MATLEKTALEANRAAIVTEFLASDKPYASSGLAGRLMNPGYTGKIVKFDMPELEGTGITPLQDDLVVNGKQIGNKKGNRALLSIIFEDGRSVALASLTNHTETTINGTPAYMMGGTDWAALIGKQLTCNDRTPDEKKARDLPATDTSAARRTIPQIYKLTVA